MNLVIDVGNSRTKLAVFDRNTMIDSLVFESILKSDLDVLLSKYPTINQCIISSVQKTDPVISDFLIQRAVITIILDSNTPLPFKNTYKTPKTLGMDRIAAIAGAIALYPKKNILIIDAGTAITFDVVDEKSQYQGGTISPGLEMRFKALNHFTAKLPLLNKTDRSKLIGESTDEAIENGVQNGMIFEIEGYLTKIGNLFPQLVVLLTGGDGPFFDNKLKNPIFAVSNLTLVGLNYILEYNAQSF